MKKFSMFIKRTLFVVLPALFACSLSIGQLHDIDPTFADGEESSEVNSSYDVENEIYTIKKTGDHAIELLFNANPKVYKNFRKNHLDELKNSLTEILKDIVHTKITELSEENTVLVPTYTVVGTGGQEDDPQPDVVPTEIPEDQPQLVHEVSNYISLETYSNMVYDYTEDANTGEHNLHQIIEAVVVGYAHFWVKEQIRRNEWENTYEVKTDVFNDFCTILAYRLKDQFGVSASEVYAQFSMCGNAILSPTFKITLDHITGMMLLIKDRSPVDNELGVKDLISSVGGQSVKDEIDELVNACTRMQLINFFSKTPKNVVIVLTKEINFTGSNLNEVVETIGVETFIQVAKEIGVEDTRDIIKSLPEFNTSDFIAKVTEVTTAKDVWSAIDGIEVDGVLIMKDKQFLWDGLVDLFGHFPPLSELANYNDNQWRHNFKVVMHTAVEDVLLDVNLGFKGNCKYLRKAAKIIDKHIKIKQDGEHFNIEVDVPGFLASMYRYLCEADFFDADLKHELFDLAFSTVDEAYNHVHSKTIEDLMANAEQIDYKILAESIISADEIKEFFGITRFVTQEKVDKFINKVFWAIDKSTTFDINRVYELVDEYYEIPEDLKDKINKVYEKAVKLLKKIAERDYDADFIHDYLSAHTSEEINEKVEHKIDSYLENAKVQNYYNRFQRLLEKVYARVPAKFRNKSLMDYYRGNSVWSGSGSAHFNVTKLVRKIPKVGPKIADFLSGFFDKFPTDASVDLKFTVHDLYRISYHLGDETKTGALPSQVSKPGFFANRETVFDEGAVRNIVGWYEKVGEQNSYLYEMPAYDVDAYPIWFKTSGNVERNYEKDNVTTISVTPNVETNKEFVYSWYKNGELLMEEEGPSITVTNHSDSGVYTCYVDGVKVDDIDVSIERIKIDTPTQSNELTFTADTTYNYYESLGLTPEEVENLPYNASGDLTGSEAGEYLVQFTFSDTDNYEWGSGNGSYSWLINKRHIEIASSSYIWSDDSFVYDATEHEVHIDTTVFGDNAKYLDFNYTGEQKGTNANNYEVTVTVSVKEEYAGSCTLGGELSSTHNWIIEKAHIETFEAKLVQDVFDYDGKEHTAEIDPNSLPAGITGVIYDEDSNVKETNIGKYTLVVEGYEYDHDNYILDGDYQTKFEWEIIAHVIDVSNVTWDYTEPFVYDENVHTVSVINVPTGVKVEYSGVYKATADNTYVAHARLYTSEYNQLYYNGEYRQTVNLDLEWKIVKKGEPIPLRSEFYSEEQNEAGTSLVWISLSSGIKGDYTLHAEEVDTSKYDFNSIMKSGTASVVTCYEINLFDSDGSIVNVNVDAAGNVIDPNFTFTVRILVPETHAKKDLVLVYVNASGEVSRIEGTRDGNYMVFTTNHLSIYGLVETHVAGEDPFPYLIVAAAATLAVQATTSWLLIVLAKRKRRTVKDAK